MNARELANDWYEKFSRFAEDLCPGRYTPEYTLYLAEMGLEIAEWAKKKQSIIVTHNYLYPEFHEISHQLGDSLGLSLYVRDKKAPRVDFEGVYFMGETAKIITGEKTRVFVQDTPENIGCSLVFGTNYQWIEGWKKMNPGGILVTYINSSAYLKSTSDYICTSRNATAILKHAHENNPGRKILVLPDKYLGRVMLTMAGLPPEIVDVYNYSHNGFNACCYVHEKVNSDVLERAMEEHPDATILIHPECECASVCLFKIQSGEIPLQKAYFLSTEKMIWHAKESEAKEFIVATEKGMIYRLRKEMWKTAPDKKFYPAAEGLLCDYMKANTFEKLLRSLKEDRMEIVLCDDCCDPQNPYSDEKTTHLQKAVAQNAKKAIERMLTIV